MHRWIAFGDAREELEEHLLRQSETDYLEAVKSASRLIMSALVEGLLPSRPYDPSAFSLEFRSPVEVRTFTLEDDGTIPILFWLEFREVSQQPLPPLATLAPPSEASSFGSEFNFVRRGLRDDGILIGNAGVVELRRDRLPRLPGGLPRPRGRPPGPSVARRANDAVYAAAKRAIQSGEIDYTAAIQHFAPQLSGPSERKVKSNLLREWLARDGIGSTNKC